MKHIPFFSLTLCFFFAASANALKINSTGLKDWRINDLSKAPTGIRMLTGGADATIVPTKGKAVPTVFVFKQSFKKAAHLKASVEAWKGFVKGLNPSAKIVFRKAEVSEVNGQQRFYAEILSNSSHGDQMYSAFLFVKKGDQVIDFSYDASRDEYFANLKKVKALYKTIKVEE